MNLPILILITAWLVGLIFLSLKLIGLGLPAEWSWWIVLFPWYGSPLILFSFWVLLISLSKFLSKLADLFGWYARELRKRRERREGNNGK